MKGILSGAFLLGSAISFGLPGVAHAAGNYGPWYFDAKALAMFRSAPSGGIIVAGNPNTTTSFLSASDLSFNAGPGIDATLGYQIFANDALEFRGMYSQVNGANSFLTPGGFIGTGFTGPANTKFDINIGTTLASGELNWKHDFNDHFSALFGLRALSLNDVLDSQINTTVARGRYDAQNSLYGAQIGTELSLFDASNPFQLSLSGKLGAYANQSNAKISEFQGANQTFIGGFGGGDQSVMSIVGDVGLTAEYKISTRVALTAGYQALWASNLALASNAASGSLLNPSLLNTNVFRDSLWMQGVSVGMRITF